MADFRDNTVSEKLLTPANIVTLVRICCVPVFVIVIMSPWPAWIPSWSTAEIWKPWIAAGVFILLAATDGLDGYLARSRNEVTTFGKFMDPLADKILVAAALLALIELSVLPSWVALVILTREFIVSGIRMVAASKGVVIAASWYGKAKTVAQIVAIVLFIIKDSEVITSVSALLANPLYLFSWFVMLLAVALTIVSMLDYFVKARELLGFSSSEKKSLTPSFCSTSNTKAAMNYPRSLEERAQNVIQVALEKGLTIGTAESLTGGLIAGTLTSVPGSSAVVRGGIVSYTNAVKQNVLTVDSEELALRGAVSEEVAQQMAEGACRLLSVDIALSVTGIAGPGGAEPGKPVGTVWIGVAKKDGKANASQYCFSGIREEVRTATILQGLRILEETLESFDR